MKLVIYWNPLHALIAFALALTLAYALTYFLHLRYDRQFGKSFLFTGTLALLPPSLFIFGIPVFLILAADLTWYDQLMMLGLLALSLLWTFWRLKSLLLRKIFRKKTKDQFQDNAAVELHG